MAARDFGVVQSKLGVDDIAPDHLIRLGKIMLVVAVSATKSDDCGYGVAAAAGAPCTLLVVGATGGGIFRKATPDNAPRSIPTSIVVVLDRMSIAVDRPPNPDRAISWNRSSFSSALENTSSFCGALSWAVCSAAMSAIGCRGGSSSASVTGLR